MKKGIRKRPYVLLSDILRPYILLSDIAGWEEERSGPTGKSFRFVRACVRAVIVKWK